MLFKLVFYRWVFIIFKEIIGGFESWENIKGVVGRRDVVKKWEMGVCLGVGIGEM